jgi:hypothetical protein
MPKYKEMVISFMWLGYGVCVGMAELTARLRNRG